MRLAATLFILLSSFLMTSCARHDTNTLRVGMDLRYPPFETRNTQGEPDGISVDIAKALGEFLGRPVQIVDTNFASLVPALNAKDIDIIIASMSRTDERELAVDFSEPYLYFKILGLVNRSFAEKHGITEQSTASDVTSIQSTRYTGVSGQVSASLPASLGFDVQVVTTLEAAVLNVAQGAADVLTMSSFPVTRGHMANPNDTLVVWDSFESFPINMGVRKGETELLQQANAFIQTLSQPKGVYEQLQAKWNDTIEQKLGRFGIDFFVNP